MVHGVAEQSGGRFVLKSKKGVGTTAEIWLPATMPAATAKRVAPAHAEVPIVRPLIILAVDDDNLVLRNTASMLEDLGHTVFESASGGQAMDIMRRKRIDLVITDQAMPGMTGAQLAEAITADWPDVPIVIATGFAEMAPGLAENLPRLSKPFDQAALARSVSAAIHTKRDSTSVVPFKAR
jgi:CheY-like chemotaxis protein